jgi:hypothetical protein
VEGSENSKAIKAITLAQLDANQAISRLRKEYEDKMISDTTYRMKVLAAADAYKEVARKYIYSAPMSTAAYFALFQQIVDRYHNLIKKSFEGLGMSFDIYSRTSSATHAKTASEFFRKLYDEGKFIEQTSMQYYDEETQTFLADRYIVGTCPKCGNDRAYGDQCEKCGSTLSPDELIDPHSAVSGSVPVKRETKHWYLPLDRYEEFLREWILDGHKEWKTNVYGQCKSWLDGGLQPRAVSRDLDWGIPVPVEGAEGKVLYVWFDAPIGYISATKDLTPDWERYWKSEDTKMVHFIGKDNIVFHCIVFPSMLKAHGDYILPENVPANEFLNLEGDKISTSRNWAVWRKRMSANAVHRLHPGRAHGSALPARHRARRAYPERHDRAAGRPGPYPPSGRWRRGISGLWQHGHPGDGRRRGAERYGG